MEKKTARLRRAKSTRAHIRELAMARLSVHRSNQHLYAQVFAADGSRVIAAASTLQKAVGAGLKGSKNLAAAAAVGKAVAERALAAGVEKVHSIVPASAITAASRRWPMLHAKPASSFDPGAGAPYNSKRPRAVSKRPIRARNR